MTDEHRPPGKTTVSPEVLIDIARMAALSVPGVKGVSRAPTGMDRLFRRGSGDGVQIAIQDNLVSGDIYLTVRAGFNLREVGRDVQKQVARAIQEMVGMDTVRIDIHVENIDYEGTEA
jgi:uncharacterized alkaline shock family protein YloU